MPASCARGPAHWQADVVLSDGGTAHLRPLGPSDRQAMVELWSRVSDSSKYLRYFAAHPTLSDADLDALTVLDHHDHVGLALTLGPRIIAVAHFDVVPQAPQRPGERVGVISFLVEDAHQGRGAANILLEHLSQVGRECGVDRFFAEMLTQNRTMVQVFLRGGYSLTRELEDGNIVVSVELDPTERSREVMEQREHRAESSAIAALVSPSSIAVVGSATQMAPVVGSLTSGGFAGRLAVSLHGADVESCPADDLAAIDGEVDLVVARVTADQTTPLLRAAADRGAKGLVLLAGDSWAPSVDDSDRELIGLARSLGVRVLGPRSLGIVNTSAGVRLNTTPMPMPRGGSVGLLAQSSGVATVVLGLALDHDLPLSTFIATGTLADVTTNDVMQFWCDNEATGVCLLSLDSVGNPRKFFRILRRLTSVKPVVVFTPSRALGSARPDRATVLPQAPASAIDQVIGRTGAIVVDRRGAMVDVASILSRQPAPRGPRLRFVTNSSGLAEQLVASARRFGLSAPEPEVVAGPQVPDGLAAATRRALSDPEVHAVVTAAIEVVDPVLDQTRPLLEQIAASTDGVPLVAVLTGAPSSTRSTSASASRLPVFHAYADALEAIGLIVAADARRGDPPDGPTALGDDVAGARRVISDLLEADPRGRFTTHEESAAILAAYGVELLDRTHVSSLEEAVSAAAALGWDVVLKSASTMTGRADTVFTHIEDADSMAHAWAALHRAAVDLGMSDEDPARRDVSRLDASRLDPVVQAVVGPGTALTVRALEDAVLGPMVSVGVAGAPAELLDDLAWAVPPLGRRAAIDLVNSLGAAQVLHGHGGTRPVEVDAVADVLSRLSRLKDDLPSVVDLRLDPVIAGVERAWVLSARIRVAPRPDERDPLARRAT